jgi:hypothetical protein
MRLTSGKKENKMRRYSGVNPTAPITRKYKSRWDVRPNDVENKVNPAQVLIESTVFKENNLS